MPLLILSIAGVIVIRVYAPCRALAQRWPLQPKTRLFLVRLLGVATMWMNLLVS